jgi:catechol 2,3-dioxygenase-like lactoylglutathione lyase family enzyme
VRIKKLKAKLVYTGIRVKDMDESIKFYTQVLGMKARGRHTIEATNGEVAGLVSEDGGPELELNYYREGSKYYEEYTEGQQLDHLAFQVENVEKALEEAKRFGHGSVLEIRTQTSMWAYVQDPNGIFIELFA